MTLRHLLVSVCVSALFLSACAAEPTPAEPAPTNVPPVVRVETAAPTPQPTATSTTQPATATNAAAPTTPAAVRIPDPAAYSWALVSKDLTDPTDIQNAADGSGRLFIIEQPGRIRILKDGKLAGTPFLDITGRVGNNGSEQGLLGLAFHPGFAQNGYLFVNYTDRDGNTHIARFSATGDLADPGSEKQLLFAQQPFANHNGGALAFGPDGYLYIGLGDGGSGGDPYGNAQSGNSLLGKLLRIDVDNGEPYAIPDDNPFAGGGEVYPEIWATGLRNPWRFSFDRLTGDLWVADVGQNQWEEINYVPAGTPGGLNFGWNKMEASHPFKGEALPEFTAPVAEYTHSEGCSVSGGAVYRGAALPEWQGVYLYGDYCTGIIWGLATPPQAASPTRLFQTGFRISTFGLDEAGELYVADYQGAIYRLEKK